MRGGDLKLDDGFEVGEFDAVNATVVGLRFETDASIDLLVLILNECTHNLIGAAHPSGPRYDTGLRIARPLATPTTRILDVPRFRELVKLQTARQLTGVPRCRQLGVMWWVRPMRRRHWR